MGLQVFLVEDGVVVLVEDLVAGERIVVYKVGLPICFLLPGLLDHSDVNQSEFAGRGWREKGVYFLLESQLIDFWVGVTSAGLLFLLALYCASVDGGSDLGAHSGPVDLLAVPEGVDVDGFNQIGSQLPQVLSFEGFGAVGRFVSVEGCFKGHSLAVGGDVHHVSSSGLPPKVGNAKATVLIAELGVDFAHDPGEHPGLNFIVVLAGVDEGAEFPAVAVQVDEVLDLVSLEDEVADHFLEGSDDRIEELVGASGPLPVCV